MTIDSYHHFDDVKLLVFQEVFSGVWDTLFNGRVELVIDATRAIPMGGRYTFRDTRMLSWDCVVASHHPLALMDDPFSDNTLYSWPSLVHEDTSRTLPRRTAWLLDNQERLVVPNWKSSAVCISAGLYIGMVSTHFVEPWLNEGKWVVLELESPFPDSACCLTWQRNDMSPALARLLGYFDDNEMLNKERPREPEETPATGN